jgi:hypothetical protein
MAQIMLSVNICNMFVIYSCVNLVCLSFDKK